MKEVSCNHADECGYWCHAASPHLVTEICERDYCMEVRRQVQCEPVPVPVSFNDRMHAYMDAHPEGPFSGKAISLLLEATGKAVSPELTPEAREFYRLLEEQRAAKTAPPETCTRRVLGICDLNGIACAVVYDGVTCRRGRPTLPGLPHIEYQDIPPDLRWMGERLAAHLADLPAKPNALDKFRALAHDRDMKQRKVWHAFGRSTYRGVPVVKSDYLVPEEPETSADDLIVNDRLDPATRLCPNCGADLRAWAETLGGPCCEPKR